MVTKIAAATHKSFLIFNALCVVPVVVKKIKIEPFNFVIMSYLGWKYAVVKSSHLHHLFITTHLLHTSLFCEKGE